VSKSTWNGTLIVNLLTLPVALHRATDDEDIKFNQVHDEDGGKIRYDRVCTACGKDVAWEHIGKGREVAGKMLVFTDEELESLPRSGVMPKIIGIDKFIPAGSIDPTALGTAYNIVPEAAGLHAYALLRQGLKSRRRVGIGRFMMRAGSRDALVVLRPYGKMLVLQRVAWPQDIRTPEFRFLGEDVTVKPVETELAGQLIDLMSGKWDPDEYVSSYPAALEAMLAAKLAGTTPAIPETPEKVAAMQDIGQVLELAIQAKKREKAGDTEEDTAEVDA
jgi:DNA end-binding protein Ku